MNVLVGAGGAAALAGVLCTLTWVEMTRTQGAPRVRAALAALLVVTAAVGVALAAGLLVDPIRDQGFAIPFALLGGFAAWIASAAARRDGMRPRGLVALSGLWTAAVYVPFAVVAFAPTVLPLGTPAGVLDLGGDLPVHIAGGAALLAWTIARPPAVRADGGFRAGGVGSVLATLALWCAALVGLNLSIDGTTPSIVVATFASAVAAGGAWSVVARLLGARWSPAEAGAGLVCGLVAVSAGAVGLDPVAAAVTGATAGAAGACLLGLRRLRADRTRWAPVAVHLVGGVVGLIGVGSLDAQVGLLVTGRPAVVLGELGLAVAAIAWSVGWTTVILLVVRRTAAVRHEPAAAATVSVP